MHDIEYDPIHDEISVPSPFDQAVLTFRGGAEGQEAPIRVIQGPATQLAGVQRIEVDPLNNEIFIPQGRMILVFSREANGNVEPKRVIRGPNTGLRNASAAAVDPINNVLVVGDAAVDPEKVIVLARGDVEAREPGSGSLLIFDRTASGDSKPIRVIQGPKTGIIATAQLQVYSPKGWIVAASPGTRNEQETEGIFVGIWSVKDNGDVPPRWKLAGPASLLKKPRGVALNPKNKEIIVADMRLNALLTYYFPEMF